MPAIEPIANVPGAIATMFKRGAGGPAGPLTPTCSSRPLLDASSAVLLSENDSACAASVAPTSDSVLGIGRSNVLTLPRPVGPLLTALPVNTPMLALV